MHVTRISIVQIMCRNIIKSGTIAEMRGPPGSDHGD